MNCYEIIILLYNSYYNKATMSVIQYISNNTEYHVVLNPSVELYMTVVAILNKFDNDKEQIIADVEGTIRGIPKDGNINMYIVYQIIRHIGDKVSMDPVGYYAGHIVGFSTKTKAYKVFNIIHINFASRAARDSAKLSQGIIMQYNPEVDAVFYKNERPGLHLQIGANTVYKRQLYGWGNKTGSVWQRFRDADKIAEYLKKINGHRFVHMHYNPDLLKHVLGEKNYRAYAKFGENGEVSDLIMMRVKKGKNTKTAVLRYFENLSATENFLVAKGYNYVIVESNCFLKPQDLKGKMYFIQKEYYHLLFQRVKEPLVPYSDSESTMISLI